MSRSFFGKPLVLCVAAALLVLATGPSAWGQHIQGRVNVTVVDPQGSVIPGAKLQLTDAATGEVRSAETRSSGTYSFVNLSPGRYKLTVTQEGFQQS
ncbi:MAG: carboxypeptidase-like regulatory domain-containing protein, partial [Candidatus Acidiferrales bacterium]